MPRIPVFTTTLDKRGFIISKVRPGAEIGLVEAKANTQTVIDISGGANYPILVDIREIKSVSKEARDHFSMRGRKPNVTAIAMLVNSPLSRIIGNFFLGLNKPTVPTQMFNSETDAIAWMIRYTETGEE
ncbi:MAG TPA: hypothetical protein VFJ43_03915 [Bacteroidia bacterium]|nr:hypothetical protein [Bacteroidia bacterium]